MLNEFYVGANNRKNSPSYAWPTFLKINSQKLHWRRLVTSNLEEIHFVYKSLNRHKKLLSFAK